MCMSTPSIQTYHFIVLMSLQTEALQCAANSVNSCVQSQAKVHFPWRYEHRWSWTLKCWQEPPKTNESRPGREASKLREVEKMNREANKNPGRLGYKGDYTTQLYGDCSEPLEGSMSPVKKRVSVWFFKKHHCGIDMYFWGAVLELVLPDPSKLRVHPRSFTTQIWFPLCCKAAKLPM